MAKESGMGDRLFVGGYDLSGDIGSLQKIGGGPNSPFDTTDITQSAMDRLGGLLTGSIDFTAYHNTSAARAHVRLSLLPTTDVHVSYFRGTTLNGEAASMTAKQINYDPTRAQDGSLTIAVNALSTAALPLTWGVNGTAGIRTDTTGTTGSAIDSGAASTTFGLSAYMHVFSFTGTSFTATIHESSDNSGDAYAAVVGGAFAAASAIGSQRIVTALNLTVERYLKIITTGTFSEASFAIVIVRNQTAPVFS